MAQLKNLSGLPFALALALSAFGVQAETVKIAFMDPLSGPFANVGQNQLKSWQFMAEYFNKTYPKGPQFEIVPFDNKGSPQESLNTLKAAIDQGIRYITQGNGSRGESAFGRGTSLGVESRGGSSSRGYGQGSVSGVFW